MIGHISGTILEKQPPFLLVDVNGIGYELLAPMTTFYHLPAVGELVNLHCHFVVREDAHILFGFFQRSERDLFRCLIKVNSVGPKLALSILSSITSTQFVDCIDQKDVARLTAIPGIGKKTAERLLIEMRDMLDKWHRPKSAEIPAVSLPSSQTVDDAMSALLSLGYKSSEAKHAIDRIYKAELSSEQLIRAALQNLAKGTVHG